MNNQLSGPLIVATGLCRDYHVPVKASTWKQRLLHLIRPRLEIKHSVIDLDFEIAAGECVGMIGPNGAGKSTTIKMLTGILLPTSGDLRVHNYAPHRDRLKYVKHIGVVFGQRSQLWQDLNVMDSYQIIKTIYDVPEREFQERLDRFTERMGLAELLHKPVHTLSLGQRMLCEIVAAFLHGPLIVFLDEPTIGLDIEVKARIRSIIKALNTETKTTILITSHDINDIERLCPRIMLIHQGRLMFDGAIDVFKAKAGDGRRLAVRVDPEHLEAARVILLENPATRGIPIKNENGWLELNPGQRPVSTVLRILEPFHVHDVKIIEQDLEDVVHRFYSELKSGGSPNLRLTARAKSDA